MLEKSLFWGPTLDDRDIEEINKMQGPILIVGASGFIGANLLHIINSVRKDVYGCSQQVDQSWRILPNKSLDKDQLLPVDITEKTELAKMIQKLRPQTIFNVSAYGAYERQSEVSDIYEVNFKGSINLLEELKKFGFRAFVQAGSSSEYGSNCEGPSEDDHPEPNSHYSVSKGALSLLVNYYGKKLGLPINHLRLYSIYGPWEERDRLIPTIVSNGLEKRWSAFADKNISRDFVYIDDCVRAFVKSALIGCTQYPGETFNIGTGKSTTLDAVANTSKDVFQLPGEAIFKSFPNRKWDLTNWYSNPKKAHELLGWSSRVNFVDGLIACKEWEIKAKNLIRFASVSKRKKKVSAIVACYRDAEAIPLMHERLVKVFTKMEIEYEVIFVNDSSPGNDETVIRNICAVDPHVIGISHSRNFGSQSAFLSGLEICSGDAAVLMDGDLQDPPELISDFLDKWYEGYDVVFGVRVKRDAPIYMQLLYKGFYRIFRKLSDIEMPVDAGDFSLIDRKVISHLIALPERDVFLRGLRAWVGFRQTGVPYNRPERMFGTSTNNFLKNIWWAKKAIFSFSIKPLEYIQRLGVLICFFAMLLSLFYLVFYFVHPPNEAKGITTIILIILGLGGLQLFSISILGDYLGKILEEVKKRPRFIRSAIIRGHQSVYDKFEIERQVEKMKAGRNG